MFSKILLSRGNGFSRALLVVRIAKSIPITHLSLNSNMRFHVYIRDLLFRYVISNFR
jgi:hypothetical protein